MLLCIQMHIKWLTQWHLKVIASAMKQHLYGQSLHPFGANNFIISHLGSTQKASYPKPNALLVVIHHFRFSYLNYVFHVLHARSGCKVCGCHFVCFSCSPTSTDWRNTQQNLCCISKTTMKHLQKPY